MRLRLTFLLLLLFLTSCAMGVPGSQGPTATPAPSSTPEPTVGPTSTPPAPLAILVIPADMDAADSKAYQTQVYNLAEAAGYRFEVLNKLTTADLDPTLKVVIALPPDPGLAQLAAAAPQAQFLAINIPGVKAAGNVSTLGAQTTAIDHVAFIAGYIAAMITQDYRTGIIVRKDSPDAQTAIDAYQAGQQFYCGLCNPATGPFLNYPLSIAIPNDAKPSEYSAYADYLIHNQVSTMFFQPEVAIPELIDYLATTNVSMIGTTTPADNPAGWVVTLQPDFKKSLTVVWPDLIAGKGGQAFPSPLNFTDVDTDLFSPGKQNLAQQTLKDLSAGLISPSVK